MLALGLVCAAAFTGVTAQENALARTIRSLDADIAAERSRQAALLAAAAEKQSGDYVIEKAAEYGIVKRGEGLIAVQRDPASDPSAPTVAGGPSRLARWIALFFGER